MKTKAMIAAVVAALCFSTSAFADPPVDCGVNISYPGRDVSSTYCGEYTLAGGGLLLCACSNGRECVDSTNDVGEIGPDGLQVAGLCTTPASFLCDNTRFFCEGRATCVGGQCCVPNACPPGTCGSISDGCGGQVACAPNGRCHAPLLTITPEFAGQPVHILDNTGLSFQFGPQSTEFSVYLSGPNGEWTWLNQPLNGLTYETDAYGSYNGLIGPLDFQSAGMWSVQVRFQYPSIYGFWVSNTVYVDVAQ